MPFSWRCFEPFKTLGLLKNPPDLLEDVPRDRFPWKINNRADGLHVYVKTRQCYFLDENTRHFDPEFFKISPAEAEYIDPQHRLLLENVYEAIESAGMRLEDLHGTDVDVFVGLMADEHYQKANRDIDASCGQVSTTGTPRSMAANCISYTFDFRGLSLSIATACSSSLMAVHLAVSSLRRGESCIAFACGANLMLAPNPFKGATRMGMISADGRRYAGHSLEYSLVDDVLTIDQTGKCTNSLCFQKRSLEFTKLCLLGL
jgi:acyl transferase domain-containing protein